MTETPSKTKWIAKLEKRQTLLSQSRRYCEDKLRQKAPEKWAALVQQIRTDVAYLHESPVIMDWLLNGEISINDSPSLHKLNLTRPVSPRLRAGGEAPEISLTVTLDSDAKSITIHQVRKERHESDIVDDDRLRLHIEDDNQISIRDRTGHWLEIEQVSEYILSKFLEKV